MRYCSSGHCAIANDVGLVKDDTPPAPPPTLAVIVKVNTDPEAAASFHPVSVATPFGTACDIDAPVTVYAPVAGVDDGVPPMTTCSVDSSATRCPNLSTAWTTTAFPPASTTGASLTCNAAGVATSPIPHRSDAKSLPYDDAVFADQMFEPSSRTEMRLQSDDDLEEVDRNRPAPLLAVLPAKVDPATTSADVAIEVVTVIRSAPAPRLFVNAHAPIVMVAHRPVMEHAIVTAGVVVAPVNVDEFR